MNKEKEEAKIEKIKEYIKRYRAHPYLYMEENFNIKLLPYQKFLLRIMANSKQWTFNKYKKT